MVNSSEKSDKISILLNTYNSFEFTRSISINYIHNRKYIIFQKGVRKTSLNPLLLNLFS